MDNVKTEFKCEVVRLPEFHKHPNADTLSIVEINGYPVIIRTEDWKPGDKAIYVPVDSIVPTQHALFNWLDKPRVRAKRLRGIFSMGLVVPAQPEMSVGDDVAKDLGIEKYLTPQERNEADANFFSKSAKRGGNNPIFMPIYGLDALRRYKAALVDGETVVITEKIHGCNARYAYHNGRFYVGSHRVMRGVSRHRITEWLTRVKLTVMDKLGFGHRAHTLQKAGDVWWQTAEKYGLKEKLAKHPNMVVYGEIYGKDVQDLTYDAPLERKFVVFDVYDYSSEKFLDWDLLVDFCSELGLPMVPLLAKCGWSSDLVSLANGWSNLGDCIREGIVVKPIVERRSYMCGRVALKYAGEDYLLRKEADAA